jgi:hypothetical protein
MERRVLRDYQLITCFLRIFCSYFYYVYFVYWQFISLQSRLNLIRFNFIKPNLLNLLSTSIIVFIFSYFFYFNLNLFTNLNLNFNFIINLIIWLYLISYLLFIFYFYCFYWLIILTILIKFCQFLAIFKVIIIFIYSIIYYLNLF